MKTRINNLLKTIPVKQALIYDKYHIQYLCSESYDVGERFIGLYIKEGQEPVLFLNKLFPKPKNIKVIFYEDHDDPMRLLMQYIDHDLLGVDGNTPSRFILPLIQKGIKLCDISQDINQLRVIKNHDEFLKLKEASRLNDEIMHKVRAMIKPGISEIEMSEAINKMQSTSPLEGVSFPSLVLFSENAADPHGEPSDRKYKLGDSVLVDMGGFYQGYASDMTRTFISDNPLHQKIYKIVCEANQAALNMIKPGVSFAQIDHAARQVITKHGYGPYFVHRTGHGIGIECHEYPDVSSDNDLIVKEGMCFSIEPGIYLNEKIGVRVEDLVYVSQEGAIVLNHYPKLLKDITL